MSAACIRAAAQNGGARNGAQSRRSATGAAFRVFIACAASVPKHDTVRSKLSFDVLQLGLGSDVNLNKR